MKIASYVTKNGDVAGFHEQGRICLYEHSQDSWSKTKELPFELNPDLSLAELKAGIRRVVTQLDDCRLFVVREVRGLVNALLLEEFGFRTWQAHGPLLEQLDTIVDNDREFAAAQAAKAAAGHTCRAPASRSGCGSGCSSRPSSAPLSTALQDIAKPLPVPQAMGNGCYRINLAEILANDNGLNSKQVLVPFMAGVRFTQLEVLCDHPPRWFARELYKLDLAVASEQPVTDGKGVRVLVVPLNDRTALQV